MELENVKCPSCGNEEEFEVSVRYRKERNYYYKVQNIPEAHILTCTQCGAKTGYKAAQIAYQENWNQQRETSIVPVDMNIPISWIHSKAATRSSDMHDYHTSKIFIPCAAYAMSIEGIGGRSVPSDVVFYVGLTIPDDFHSYKLRGGSRSNIEAKLTIVWQDRSSKWHRKVVGESEYSTLDKSKVEIDINSVLNPSMPPDKIKQALDFVYKEMSNRKIDPADDNIVNSMPWKGDRTFMAPLPQEDVETVLSWIRWAQTAPSYEDIQKFSVALPKGWYARPGVSTQWKPIIIYSSGRGKLKRLEPDAQGRRSYQGYPIYFEHHEDILRLPENLMVKNTPDGDVNNSWQW